MPVKCHIATVHLDDCGDKRGTIEIGTPILVQHGWRFITEITNAFPDSHTIFLVLALNILDACNLTRALLQLPAGFKGVLVQARLGH